MRIACLAVLVGLSGCGHRAGAQARDGTLVLEVGGTRPSLRKALQERGIVIDPAASGPAAPVPRAGDVPVLPVRRAGPDPASASAAGVDPAPAPQPPHTQAPPPPTFRTVTLQKGETLTMLARRHLGDGNRYRELLQLNGWSSEQSKHLQVGTLVKIPIEPRQ